MVFAALNPINFLNGGGEYAYTSFVSGARLMFICWCVRSRQHRHGGWWIRPNLNLQDHAPRGICRNEDSPSLEDLADAYSGPNFPVLKGKAYARKRALDMGSMLSYNRAGWR